jgi:hypothetical protein
MLNFDNKPSIYLCLQFNGDTLGVENLFFGIIYVSLSSRAIKSNSQNLCISPLSTNLNYISSKVLSLYCVFYVQNLVLCLTCELLNFLDYKIMRELHLILPLLVKCQQNRTRIYFRIMF